MKERFISALNSEHREALLQLSRHGDKPTTRRRAHAVLLSDQGHTLRQISTLLKVSSDAVAQWAERWEAEGIEGLSNRPGKGRQAILDDDDRGYLEQMVRAQDRPFRSKTLHARFEKETGIHLSIETFRRELEKVGAKPNRSRLYSVR